MLVTLHKAVQGVKPFINVPSYDQTRLNKHGEDETVGGNILKTEISRIMDLSRIMVWEQVVGARVFGMLPDIKGGDYQQCCKLQVGPAT